MTLFTALYGTQGERSEHSFLARDLQDALRYCQSRFSQKRMRLRDEYTQEMTSEFINQPFKQS